MADISKLKDRHVAQWGLAYLGGAWLVIQVLDAVADPWNVPLGVQRAVGVLLAVGFFATLVVAWYHGERGRQRISGPELLILSGILAVAALLVPRVLVDGAARAVESAEGAEGTGSALLEGTVAVLPFDDLSPDGDHQYFADGLSEEIISSLVRDGRIRVAARTSTFALRGQPISKIGAELSVATVLEGSVRRDGDTVRVTAQLVGVEDGFSLWSTEFDRSLESVLQVQEEISSAVVAQLTGTTPEPTSRTPTIAPAAYDRYLQGRFFWNRRTQQDLLRAVAMFEEAVSLAPEYAPAYAGMADAFAVLGFYQYLPPDSAFPAAMRFADQALELDPELVEPIATTAYAQLYYEWDWPAAEASFQEAIALNRQYPVAHQWYGNLLVVQGRIDEAVEQLRIATELDPLSMIARSALGWAYTYGREYERAVAVLRQVLLQDPGYMVAYQFSGDALLQLSDSGGAVAAFERAAELSGRSPITVAGLAHALARVGRREEAVALLEELTDQQRTTNPPPYDVGKVYLALGRVDDAFTWFERAYSQRANALVFIGVDPEVDEIRGDARYRDLLNRIGLSH